MPRHPLARLVLLVALECASGACKRVPATSPDRPLSALAPEFELWNAEEGASDQTPAFELGRSPRDRAAGLGAPVLSPRVPRALWELARTQWASLHLPPHATLEAWPSRDAFGRPTWVFARVRTPEAANFRFFWHAPLGEERADGPPVPVFPRFLDPGRAAQRQLIFAPFDAFDDLYQKPVFANCVWVDRQGRPFAGWLPSRERAARESTLVATGAHCVVLPQPARLEGRPHGFLLTSSDTEAPALPAEVTLEDVAPAPELALGDHVPAFPELAAGLAEDVRALDGESEAVFPLSQRRARFTRRSSAQRDHQLLDVVSYLEERYARLGIPTERQSFSWLGIPQANLVAKLSGRDGSPCAPVLLVDHMDVAFAEDVFAARHERVAVPGADDNALATAALLRMADALRAIPRTREVWFVHLTGEEFPADDLGARHFVAGLLETRCAPSMSIVLDMIGWHGAEPPLLQLNASAQAYALSSARLASRIAAQLEPKLETAVRPPYDPRNYVYNTDALVFSEAGIPALLFNEHVNALENLERPGYHDTQDLSSQIDFEFAARNVRVAAATAAALAR